MVWCQNERGHIIHFIFIIDLSLFCFVFCFSAKIQLFDLHFPPCLWPLNGLFLLLCLYELSTVFVLLVFLMWVFICVMPEICARLDWVIYYYMYYLVSVNETKMKATVCFCSSSRTFDSLWYDPFKTIMWHFYSFRESLQTRCTPHNLL